MVVVCESVILFNIATPVEYSWCSPHSWHIEQLGNFRCLTALPGHHCHHWNDHDNKGWVGGLSAFIPQNRSCNQISLTFSLTKMIYALLSKNVVSRIYALLLAKFAKVPGLGGGGGRGQPNFGNARILGAYVPPTHPLLGLTCQVHLV